MSKTRYGLLLLSFVTLNVYADTQPKDFLMNQVIWGETYHRDDFVKNSLDRLQLIDPDSPSVISAQIRLAVRQKNFVLAEKLLDDLKQKAAYSAEYRQAKRSLFLAQPIVQQKLQQARVMAMSGHLNEAKAQYDALFHGDFPTLELSCEYWTLVSRIPQFRETAFSHLEMIYAVLKAHQIYTNKNNQKNWSDDLKITLSKLWDSHGNNALKSDNLNEAKKKYQEAIILDSANYFAWVGLGDIEYAHKNIAQAEEAYKRAYSINPNLTNAIYGLLSIYKHQSLQNALYYLDSLPEAQKIKLLQARNQLESSLLQEQAEQFENKNQWNKAASRYEQAQKIDPDNVWLIYHFAIALNHIGKTQLANKIFQKLVTKEKRNPEQVYAYALYLSNVEQLQQALIHLHTLPLNQWNEKMFQLSQRLTMQLIIKQAQKLYDNGNKQDAISYLMHQKLTIPMKLMLADWTFSDNNFVMALKYYQEVLNQEPLNANANLGIIETLIALGDKNKAFKLLNQLQHKHIQFDLNMQRRLANAWSSVGNTKEALALLNQVKNQSAHAAPSQDSALLYRDTAALETQLHMQKVAQEDYKKAMVQTKITPILPTTNDSYTFLTRYHEDDDWLKRSIRSGAASLYQQQETRFTVHEDYWRLNGTAGTSDLRAADTIAQADWGLYNGRAFLRGDRVNLSAGRFTTVDGIYFSNFGTCAIHGCSTDIAQQTKGVSWDGGWQNSTWGFDIGETPIGFPIVNWIGGLNYSGELYHLGWTLTASQRPMTNSLLSFAGATDPNTGLVWGGVVSSGFTLSLSYDRGGANGFWANVIASQLTGKNVPSNKRILLMDGYYYKLINEENRRFNIGLTNMIWHYEKNLYGYNLGQGGYYSPDFYLSFTIPIDYRKRTANWSYEVGGTVTWSRATTQSIADYPLPNLIPNLNNSQNTVQPGGTSVGYGYSVIGLIERRLSSHFIIGGLVNIQQSTDYTPSHLALYIRYSLQGWEGDLNAPIVPLIPYSNFR